MKVGNLLSNIGEYIFILAICLSKKNQYLKSAFIMCSTEFIFLYNNCTFLVRGENISSHSLHTAVYCYECVCLGNCMCKCAL